MSDHAEAPGPQREPYEPPRVEDIPIQDGPVATAAGLTNVLLLSG
jgi:hypothetical protein